jgi:Leucine-rich repeat (LRR) protein
MSRTSVDRGGFRLYGYERLTEHGFALPCYIQSGTTNAIYIALTRVPGEAKGTISGFEIYETDCIEALPEDRSGRRVSVGEPWLDVFLWDGAILIGTKRELWQALALKRDCIATRAPLTFLGLAEGVSHDEVRHLFDTYLRTMAVRILRGRLGQSADEPTVRRALREVAVHVRTRDVTLTVPASIERRIGLHLSFFDEVRLAANVLHFTLASVDSVRDHFQIEEPTEDVLEDKPAAEIARQLILAGEDVPDEICALVKDLDLSSTNMESIKQLERFHNLESLDLGYTQVADLTPLVGLVKLKSLRIDYTAVEDLTPLSGLISLRSLIADSTPIRNLSPIACLVRLQQLNLAETKVGDVIALSNLAELRELDLRGTDVNELSPLANMRSLRELNLTRTHIQNIEPLGNLRLLTRLELVATRVSDVSALARLTQLRVLNLWATDVVDVTPLSRLYSLRFLDLWGAPVRNKRVLRRLHQCTVT